MPVNQARSRIPLPFRLSYSFRRPVAPVKRQVTLTFLSNLNCPELCGNRRPFLVYWSSEFLGLNSYLFQS